MSVPMIRLDNVAKVYRTDRDGTVVVSVDSAGGYVVRTLGPVER